ncbi:MAG: (Fe-S)-binding protein [candidate division NC10 bacterium RIFCSPLOWO2_12_FULL_66_18]|nr:MAG: (Fe-S)-binding protein [candidate division NC10 bacterium RIFCSPLOWO2_12_FULL_66_18]
MKVLRITPDRCTGCMRCELACSYAQTGTFQPARSVIRVSPFEAHTSYAPYTCPQCAEGWCLTACPVGAITISPVGAKIVLDDQCVGCKLCTIACPYGTIFYNPETQKAFKCDLCGGDPACARACPTSAIEYVEAETADWLGAFAATRAPRHLALQVAGAEVR